MEEILARHRKEQRDLQSRITQKKKNATKKTRKGVNDECERLERELVEQQKAEIDARQPEDPNQLESAVGSLTIGDEEINGDAKNDAGEAQHDESDDQATGDQPRPKKPNRQKARLARRAAEQEAQAAAAAAEAEEQPDLRDQELSAMKKHMESRGLSEILIRPDGHCLFSACARSMPAELVSASGRNKEPYQNVRSAAAGFMAAHPDDFEAFVEEPLDSYVTKIKDTAEWGGQLELQAISRSYNIEINVLQADGRVEKFDPESAKKRDLDAIWLAYYRHSFGLGEHYNALKKVNQN